MQQEKVDFIIIGGGALGTFHAFHALENGLSVRLFEKNNRPQGSSVQNFGQVVPSGMNLKWQNFGRRSLQIYKDLQSKVDITLRPNGSVYIASNEEEMTLIEELHQINRQNDYTSILMTKEECLQKFEGLRADYCRGALFFPEEATVESREMIHRVLSFLTSEKGLIYQPSTLIREITQANGECSVIDHNGKVYTASKVLICNGYELKVLYPELFAQSDLEVVKLQMLQTISQPSQKVLGNILTGLTVRRYESFQECPSYSAIKEKEDAEALWKKWGVHILFKQCPDGSFIIGDSHEYADAINADDLGFDLYSEINEYMLEEAKKIFNLETWAIQKEWFGLYSQCKTQDIFKHTLGNDIHILTGIGGKGMTGGAGFAESHVQELFSL